MTEEKVVMAVDGGATKTAITIQLANGKTLFNKISTGSNIHAIGVEHVERVITDLLLDAYQAIPNTQIEVAAFAMAGIDTSHDLSIIKGIIENCLNNVPFEINTIIVENDVHSTLLGLTNGKPGALVLSGTGSIAYAFDGRDLIVRTGGWGHLAADEGSGYWVGQEILRAIIRAEDGRTNKLTYLKNLLFEKLQITTIEQLLSWVYHPEFTNAQMASISSILSDAIEHGDETAIHIAKNAAKELSILAITVLEKIQYNGEVFTLYMNGGILKNHIVIKDLFQQYVSTKYPNISFELCHDAPIQYILKRALSEVKKVNK
ncbi:N-acetylmuramic acid/N-acetylglucosamine kinase [Lysinibacillus sp. PLM2]|nr:N-acetylmuramic acid/N-acetylglucosamine kinase [Lysinibacillus sp. PLM2]